ncbi:MAG: hypothetical protein AAB647_03565 [Patescibacteria group bacterium]
MLAIVLKVGRWLGRRCVPISLGLLVIGGLTYFVYRLYQPVQGRLLPVELPTTPSSPTIAPYSYQGRYFEFNYLGLSPYRERAHETDEAALSEGLRLTSVGEDITWILAVGYQKMDNVKLVDLPAYANRHAATDRFSESEITVDGHLGVLFASKTYPFEQVAIILTDDTLTTIALSAESNEDRSAYLQTILDSFKWK